MKKQNILLVLTLVIFITAMIILGYDQELFAEKKNGYKIYHFPSSTHILIRDDLLGRTRTIVDEDKNGTPDYKFLQQDGQSVKMPPLTFSLNAQDSLDWAKAMK